MAGKSSRFFNAGYKIPKFMLKINDDYVFDICVNSFEKYFDKELFVFVVNKFFDCKLFVESRLEFLGIKRYILFELDAETRGQAETVAIALSNIEIDEPLTIFNIDTFRQGYTHPVRNIQVAGCLEVFEGEGENWSFVKDKKNPNFDNEVELTTEKERISNLCSTGLYYFRSKTLFLEIFNEYVLTPKSSWAKGELYIAPLYNFVIKRGELVVYDKIERRDVTFCGTPEEYEYLVLGGKNK